MLRYSFGLLFCVLLCSGCALFRPAQKQQAEQPQTASVTWENTPAQPVEKYPFPEPVIAKAVEPEICPEPEAEPDFATFYFSERETQHVRFPGTPSNPFGGETQEIKIDLKSLQSQFCYPLQGKMISPYGPRGRSYHTGMDIKAVPNDTIRAAFPGTVRMSKLYSGYGNVIVICHANGLETVYAHQTKNLVEPNQTVLAGDPIGLAGRTGRATTEHLHFEVRVGGEHLDPRLVMDFDNCCLKSDTLYVYNRGGKIRGSNKPLAASQLETGTEATGPGTASTANAAAVANAAQYHTIKSGDTLGALARKYGTTVNKICQLNNITPTTILQLNKRLRVK